MKGFVLIAFLWIIFGVVVGGFLFEYSFEFWVSLIKGHAVDLPFGLAILGGIVLSGFNIPIAIVTVITSCVI